MFVCSVFVDDAVLIVVVVTVAGFFNCNLIWTLKRFMRFKGGKVFTKQCFLLQDMDRIFLDLSCAEGAHRGIGDSLLNSKILTEDSYKTVHLSRHHASLAGNVVWLKMTEFPSSLSLENF